MIKGNIRNRLQHLETPPPPGVWDAIALALDETGDQKTAAPVVPITRNRSNRWLRIALAASVLGFVAMTALWLRDRNTAPPTGGSGATTATNTPVQSNTSPPQLGNKDSINQQPVTPPVNNTLPAGQIAENEGRPATTTVRPGRQTQVIAPSQQARNNQQLAVNPARQPDADNRNLQPLVISPVTSNNPALAQAQMKDSTGKAIRAGINQVGAANPSNVTGPLSKGDQSISRILTRISQQGDGEQLDSIIQNSPYWKTRIQEWRNILIKSGYAPSMINFMDFAELQKLLQEQKNP